MKNKIKKWIYIKNQKIAKKSQEKFFKDKNNIRKWNKFKWRFRDHTLTQRNHFKFIKTDKKLKRNCQYKFIKIKITK